MLLVVHLSDVIIDATAVCTRVEPALMNKTRQYTYNCCDCYIDSQSAVVLKGYRCNHENLNFIYLFCSCIYLNMNWSKIID